MVGSTFDYLIDFLKTIDHKKPIKNDKDLESNKEKRSRLYVEILEEYRDFIKRSLNAKIIHKWIAFSVVMLVLVVITGSIVVPFVIYITDKEIEIVAWLSLIIPLMISFLTAFIILPRIITKYLFDTDEENRMIQILQVLEKIDIDSDNNCS